MKAKEITDDFIQDIYDQCNQDTITKSDFYLSGFKDGQSHASTPTRQVSDGKLLNLIDIVWNTAFEDDSVPSTKLALKMLKKAGYVEPKKPSGVKDYLEIEFLKSLSYEEINKIMNDFGDKITKLESTPITTSLPSDLIALLEDCKYPIEHMHESNHDESELLKNISKTIEHLKSLPNNTKTLEDYKFTCSECGTGFNTSHICKPI